MSREGQNTMDKMEKDLEIYLRSGKYVDSDSPIIREKAEEITRGCTTDAEKTVYESLDSEPMHVDEIIAGTKLPPGAVNSALISLRLKALIRQLPGNLFTRSRSAN